MKSGLLIFKIKLLESHIDTNPTSTEIKMNLSNLNTYIATVGNDINKFSFYVKSLIQSLLARGDMNSGLIENLFNGYKISLDQNFIKYI